MAITKQSLILIRADLEAALATVAKKHKLTVSSFSISYNDASFKIKEVNFGSKDITGDADPLLYKDMERHGFRFGLSVKNIGKDFTLGARTFKIEGMRGNKYVIGKSPIDSKMYRFSPADVAAVLGVKPEFAF
jgi:hypothetical protein